jgi:hypothetical protein
MLSAKLLLDEIVSSLRQVIGPAISEPYPKAQAYMAATILEFVARQIEERGANESRKAAVLEALFDDIGTLGLPASIAGADSRDETALSDLISHLYQVRGEIGESAFEAANRRVRRALRDLLNLDLEVAGKGASE